MSITSLLVVRFVLYVLQVTWFSRDWKDSYLGGSCGERSGQIILIIWVSERQVDHREVCSVEDQSAGQQGLADLFFAGVV